jgi:phosphoribosyl 1,2-cyclic phosphate phosphodiesterase
LLVERGADFADRAGVTSVLIDTSPDMRAQLLAARAEHVDAALLTHDHADQTHGLDDLRAFAIAKRKRVPVYLDRAVAGGVIKRFRYCFEQAPGSWYPAILEERAVPPCGDTFSIAGPGGDVQATAFRQRHGPVDSFGYRIGALGYSSDVADLPENSFAILEGVKVWIVDALQMTPHGTHAHLERTLQWIARVKPETAILTNLHNTMDYRTLKGLLPPGVEPAFDGLIVEF